MRWIPLLLGGCLAEGPVSGPSEVPVPSRAAYDAAYSTALQHDQDGDAPSSLDLGLCFHQRVRWSLGLGSAWFLAHALPTGGLCEVWLGGETESSTYDGHPTSYCQFDRHGEVALETGAGGPAKIDGPYCIELVGSSW